MDEAMETIVFFLQWDQTNFERKWETVEHGKTRLKIGTMFNDVEIPKKD